MSFDILSLSSDFSQIRILLYRIPEAMEFVPFKSERIANNGVRENLRCVRRGKVGQRKKGQWSALG
jgi:hypothetical protein